jgi:hypothetical protein
MSEFPAGCLTIAIAFEDQQPPDDTLGILLQGQLHGLLQGELECSGRTCRGLLSAGYERKQRMQKCQDRDARSPESRRDGTSEWWQTGDKPTTTAYWPEFSF